MEDFSKLLEIMQSVKKYLAWSVLLLLLQFPIVRDILASMYNTIRITVAMICLVSLSGLLYKGLYDLFALLAKKISISQEQSRVRTRITKQIQALSQQERVVFDYVKDGDTCGVWVAEIDAAVLTLLHKGLLQRISDSRCFADWPPDTDGRANCILVVISQDVLTF